MKITLRLWVFLAFIAVAHSSFAQSLEKFFGAKGVYDLCEMGHPSNYYVEGAYGITKAYIDVAITSRDNITEGRVYTDLRLVRGTGDLYFSDIIVVRDTDPWAKPFDAFKLQIEIVLAFYKALLGEVEFNKMLTAFQETLGMDITKWTGKQWAVFALNLDYYSFVLTGK